MEQMTMDIDGVFLCNLRGKGKHKYSAYNKSPIRYAGGKSKAVGYILEHIKSNIIEMVSPFFGGGSVEIACANELDILVSGYDVFGLLANYWSCQIHFQHELYGILSKWESTKEQYDENKKKLKEYWEQQGNDFVELYGLELASLYWYNHNLSYGPGFLGWMSKIYQNPKRYESAINRVRDFCCNKLSVQQSDFTEVFTNHYNQYMYCDPPYYLDDGKMFKGIYPQRNFPVHHAGFKHEKLRDLLYSHKNGFVLSYNDCDTIREWYSDFDIHEVEWQYSMGQGETRIGKTRKEMGNNHIKKSHELLIVKRV